MGWRGLDFDEHVSHMVHHLAVVAPQVGLWERGRDRRRGAEHARFNPGYALSRTGVKDPDAAPRFRCGAGGARRRVPTAR